MTTHTITDCPSWCDNHDHLTDSHVGRLQVFLAGPRMQICPDKEDELTVNEARQLGIALLQMAEAMNGSTK